MTKAERPFNAKQRIFIEEMTDPRMKGSEAARRAGWAPKTARVTAAKLMQQPRIRAAIEEAREKQFEALHMSKAETLAEIAKVARFNVKNILHITPDGDPYWDLSKASDDDMAALSAVEIEDFVDRRERDTEGNVIARDVRRVKVKAHDKLGALKLAAQAHGLLKETVDVKVDGSFADELAAAMMRARRAKEE